MMQDCSFHSALFKRMHDGDVNCIRTEGEIRLLSRAEVVEERRQLTRLIDGDACSWH